MGGVVGLCALGLLLFFFVVRPRRGRHGKQLGSPAPHARGGASGFGSEGSPFSSPHRAPLISFAPSPVAASPFAPEPVGFELVKPGTSAGAAAAAAASMTPRVSMNPLHAAGGARAAATPAPSLPGAPLHQHWDGAGPDSTPPAAREPPVDEWAQVEDGGGAVFWRSRVTGETAWARPGSGAWERVVDGDGDMFWVHSETGETSWTRPAGATAAWEKVTDAEGDVWWVHCDTGGTSWHDPHEGEWELVVGPVGQTWYRNTATNAVAWQKPPSAVGVHGWQRVVDADNDVFYRNEATGEMSWATPVGPPPAALPDAGAAAQPRAITRWLRVEDQGDGALRYRNVDTGELRLSLPPSGVVVGSGAAL